MNTKTRAMQMSVRTVMLVVAFAAISVVCLTQKVRILPATYFSSIVLLLLYSVLAATLGKKSQRGFWIGFAFFGWSYLALVYCWPSLSSGLITNHALNAVTGWLSENTEPSPEILAAAIGEASDSFPHTFAEAPALEISRVTSVGQGFFSMCLALAGGMMGKRLAESRDRERDGTPSSSV